MSVREKMALRTAQYILDVNTSNGDSNSSGYRVIDPVVHNNNAAFDPREQNDDEEHSTHPYDNNTDLNICNLPQSIDGVAQSEISTHIYNNPEEPNGNPNSCRFDTKYRLLITLGCLVFIVSSISVSTVLLNSSGSDGRKVDLGMLTKRLTPCRSVLELGIGETKTVICTLPNVSANENSSLFIEKVDMNDSSSGFMMADLLVVKDRSNLIINFTFVNFECTDEGNYSVFILQNGTLTSIHNISVAIQVKSITFPPCQSSYNLDIRGSREIKCSMQKEKNKNYSVCIEKVEGNRSGCMNAELQLEYSSDCHRYYINFTFYAATCNYKGNYSIVLMENGTVMRLHNFSVFVQENLKKPQITRIEGTRGHIDGEDLELECKASTGCTFQNLELYHRPKGTSNDQPRNTTTIELMNSYSEYQVTTIYETTLTDQSDGDVYTCKIQGTDIASDPYTVATVEDSICEGKTRDCRFHHPSRCDVFVWCESANNPVISPCPTGQYFPRNSCKTCCVNSVCDHIVNVDCPFK